MPERIDTTAVLHKLNRATRKPMPWWPFPIHTQRSLCRIFNECRVALAQEIADGEAARKRLEQYDAEAQDKAHPEVRPMTVLENAYMDLEGKLGQAQARIVALEKDGPSAAEEDAAVAMITALPDVLGAEILREYGVTIVATIKGEVYDETQMGRLLDAECAFLEAHPDCRLSFRYVPAALAEEKKKP